MSDIAMTHGRMAIIGIRDVYGRGTISSDIAMTQSKVTIIGIRDVYGHGTISSDMPGRAIEIEIRKRTDNIYLICRKGEHHAGIPIRKPGNYE